MSVAIVLSEIASLVCIVTAIDAENWHIESWKCLILYEKKYDKKLGLSLTMHISTTAYFVLVSTATR